MSGVLKSWAVPKEPTLDPKIRRLAVEVEDHPIEYAKFSGTIPKGQYGGGTVAIWDHGTYELTGKAERDPEAALDQGKLTFRMNGEKLKGEFTLVRTRLSGGSKAQWLLIKKQDRYAVDASARVVSKRAPVARTAKPARARASGGKPGLVELTSLDKVLFPKPGITKGEVLEYYQAVAPLLLPELKDRPITLERLPEGVGRGPHFWQKNTPAHYPGWIPRVELSSETGKPVSYALVNNLETLLYLVNQGSLTFHVWFSRIRDLDRPDFVLFDLDPGKASFGDVVEIARQLYRNLESLGYHPTIKTSGKSGLHLTVPWTQSGGYDEARAWALSVASELVKDCDEIATVARSKDRREGKVYIDIMQNAKGHHAVPPYVLRPTPEATVSMPIAFSELNSKLDPRSFTIRTALERLAKHRAGTRRRKAA